MKPKIKKVKKMTVPQARKEATKILKKDGTSFTLRSCWNCNGAHEHLKECEIPLNCFACGHWYFKGIKLTK